MISVTKSVWREWRSAEIDSIALLLKSSNPAALEIARAAAERVNDLAAETALEGGVHVSPMPKGIGVTIADCDDLEPALTAFTDALTGFGIGEATLTVLPAVRHVARGGRSGIESHWLKATLTIRATPPPENTLASLAEHHWTVTPEDIEAMLRWALDFCLDIPGGAVKAEIGVNDRKILLPPEQVLPMLRAQAVDRSLNRTQPLVEIKARDGAFRVAELDFVHARASVAAGVDSADYDWAENLAHMTQVLLTAPPAVTQGVLAGGTNDTVYGLMTMHPDAPFGGQDPMLNNLATQRGVEDEQALDAFGIMMVPASFAHLMPSGPDWVIEHVDGDRIVLRWHDPAEWFTHDTLPDGLLPRARATLGALVAENNPLGSNNRFPPAPRPRTS